MTAYKKTELVLNKKFDRQSCRHKIDGTTVVLHCHHYASLYTQLAMDCSMLDAKALLAETTEDTFQEVLCNYYKLNHIESLDDRISIGEQIFAASGLGKMKVECIGQESGEVTLSHSHVDEGWLKKFGKANKPLNFIGAGFITALFSAALGLPSRSFNAVEMESIACGAPASRFSVVAR